MTTIEQLGGTLGKWLEHRRAGGLLLLVLGVVYAVAYRQHALFPGSEAGAQPCGWWTWSDQANYLRESVALAHGKLDAQSYYYPPGYSALGALFVRRMPVNPFFFPDLALVLGAAWAWWRLAQRLLSRLQTVALAVLFIATHWVLLADTMVVPWNTLVTQCTLLTGMLLLITTRSVRGVWGLAVLAALTYGVRPVDALAFAPMLAWATLRLPDWRSRLAAGAGGVAVVVLAVVALGGLNHSIFGDWRTPYEKLSAGSIGFFSYPISAKLYWLLIDGRPFFGENDPGLLIRYPWLLLAVPGACYWIEREGASAVAALAALALNWLLYFNYNDFLPSDIYRFTLIHYLVWAFPLLALLGTAACVRGGWSRGTRWGFAATAVLLIFVLGIRMEERPLPTASLRDGVVQLPAVRPLVLRFSSLQPEAVAQLRLDGRALTEYSDFLTPYESPTLQLLFGNKAVGSALTKAAGATITGEPQLSELGWTWRIGSRRLKSLFK